MRPSHLIPVFSSINVSVTSLRANIGTKTLSAAIEDVQRDLQASINEIALSLSLFILVQGISPLLWSSLSDIKGRKIIYISSMLVRYPLANILPRLMKSRFSSSDLLWEEYPSQYTSLYACVCSKQLGQVRYPPLVQVL